MRYLPLADADRQAMLRAVGAASIDDLFVDVPEAARLDRQDRRPRRPCLRARGRAPAVGARAAAISRRATRPSSSAAAPTASHPGQRRSSDPARRVPDRYTPYQPEIAQGTLQALFEFQTQVARLFGCDVANASMYDGSTACWEAIVMARRITRRGKAICSRAGFTPIMSRSPRRWREFTGDVLDTALPELDRRDRYRAAARVDRRRDQLRRRPISRHSRPHRRSRPTRRAARTPRARC